MNICVCICLCMCDLLKTLYNALNVEVIGLKLEKFDDWTNKCLRMISKGA